MNCTPGQLVRLRSGGPVMTVVSVAGDDVRCVWMEAVGKSQQKRDDTFPTVTLAPYVAPPPIEQRLGFVQSRRGY